MKVVLFNIHDLILIAVLSTCGLLAALTMSDRRFQGRSRHILVAFFVMNSLIAADTLIFWGDGVRSAAFSLSPWLLTLFSFSAFAFGPVLYGLIQCELKGRRSIGWPFALHFAPALLTPIYLYWVCYRFPVEIQRDLILNLAIYSVPDSYFATFTTLKKLAPVVYGVLCLRLVYQAYVARSGARSEVEYLMYLTAGFTVIRLWILLTHFGGLWLPQAYADLMGLGGNYLMLALLFGLVWMCVKPQHTGWGAVAPTNEPVAKGAGAQRASQNTGDALREDEQPMHGADEEAQLLEANMAKIQRFVEQEKPYLNSQLTLERFAMRVGLPARQVSLAINKGFRKNFQEYINHYRILEAQQLLSSPEAASTTVLDVAIQSGFNSKASFNRLFKNQTALTPSAYRSQYCRSLA